VRGVSENRADDPELRTFFRQFGMGAIEDVGALNGALRPPLAALREVGANVQAGRARMLCTPAEVEAETFELDS
jgi:hypothetical protein